MQTSRHILPIALAVIFILVTGAAEAKPKKPEKPPTPEAPSQYGFVILVDLKSQQAWGYREGKEVFQSAVCSGKKSTPTPKGKFEVISKHKHWVSTIYHVPMPYFLRLTPYTIGLHAGHMAGRPASHGCIRLPKEKARELFELAEVGTEVYVR